MPLITSSCGGGTDFKSEKSTLILSSEFLSPCLLQTIPSQTKQRWMFSPLFFTWLGGRGNKKVIKNIFTKHSPFCFNLCETVRTETVHFRQFLRRPDLQVKEQCTHDSKLTPHPSETHMEEGGGMFTSQESINMFTSQKSINGHMGPD